MTTEARAVTIKIVLSAIAVVFLAAQVAHADPVTINGSEPIIAPPDFATIVLTPGGPRSFVFENPFVAVQAIDFHVVSVNVVMHAGSGGPPFPITHVPDPCFAAGGGFKCITFDGGPGIPPGGQYTFSFIDFPDGAIFRVSFSALVEGKVVFAPPLPTPSVPPSTVGSVSAVPEPTAILLLGTGIAGVAIKARKRFKKPQRTGKETQ